MSKELTGITDDVIQPFYAFKAKFDSGALRIWSGLGNKVILGQNYVGSGTLLTISGLTETGDISATNCTVSLSGIPVEVISAAFNEPYQGREAQVFFGIQGLDPIEVFGGYMDVMTIEEDGQSANVSVTIESRLIELERIRPIRYTNESHKSRNPGDTFFRYVSSIQDQQVSWGPQG